MAWHYSVQLSSYAGTTFLKNVPQILRMLEYKLASAIFGGQNIKKCPPNTAQVQAEFWPHHLSWTPFFRHMLELRSSIFLLWLGITQFNSDPMLERLF